MNVSLSTPVKNKNGFTLAEMLIAMAIFGMVVAGIVASRVDQQNRSISQDQTVEMQQNARAVSSLIVREIRMAGYNPDVTDHGEGIVTAGDGVPVSDGGTGPFTFTYVADNDGVDNDNDTTTDENGELKTVSYFLKDLNSDSITNELVLNDGPLPQSATFDKLMAENIFRDEAHDGIDNNNDGTIDETGEHTPIFTFLDADNNVIAVSAADVSDSTILRNIRAVRVSITITIPANELNYTKTNNTRNLTTTVKCRNLGL